MSSCGPYTNLNLYIGNVDKVCSVLYFPVQFSIAIMETTAPAALPTAVVSPREAGGAQAVGLYVLTVGK